MLPATDWLSWNQLCPQGLSQAVKLATAAVHSPVPRAVCEEVACLGLRETWERRKLYGVTGDGVVSVGLRGRGLGASQALMLK